MDRNFIWLGRAEGISTLLLFFVAMPLKYGAGMPAAVTWVGSIHGGLFVVYVMWATILAFQCNWGIARFVMCLILSSVPFGTFYFERKILPKIATTP